MVQYNTNNEKYTQSYLNSLSPNYRKRIESYLRRNPGATVTNARGHKQSQTERAARLRQPPTERYNQSYLESLTPSYRRQIERELKRSQESQSQFIPPGSLRRKALRLYTQHLTMLGIELNDINDNDPAERTFREGFNDKWRLLNGISNQQTWIH